MTLAPRHGHPPTFAGYRIGGLLGQGAMGRVYQALDPSVGRPVALKILGRADEGSAGRFQREGELAARLDHPGIVRVHAAGSAEGQSYLVYELVVGARSLDVAWAKSSLRRRVTWIRDVARALGYAHALGVVHRDVKPENLLVNELGEVRITDFGVAGAADLERLTKTGALVGTPTHMAPEQMTGEGRPGPPTDVWALGVVLYEALCDQLPFEGHDWLTLATKVAAGRFSRPSDSGREIPAELERICQLALRTDPSARPPSGEAFAALLDDWLGGRQPERARGRGARLALAGGLLLTLGLIGAWAAWPPSARESASSPSPTSPEGPAGAQSASPKPARLSIAAVSARLRRSRVGRGRLEAYRGARDWLEDCDLPSDREVLVQRLAQATREPLARLKIALPDDRARSTLRAYTWGDRILVGADKWRACLLDPSRAEIVSPWVMCHTPSFVELDPQRA